MGRIEPSSTLDYVARFNGPLPTAQPVITIARVVGASEELVRSTTLSLAAPGYTAIWSEMPTLLDPGRYRMRVLACDTIRAQGDSVRQRDRRHLGAGGHNPRPQ